MSAYITRRRKALEAEMVEDAQRAKEKGSRWGQSVLSNLQRNVDATLLYDMHYDLRTVYLQRWSPETRARIVAAREAVTVAMRAAYREIR